MSRYFAELAYKGTSYVGWQNQPGQKAVQSTIEKALSTILREKIDVVGCGRTDAGVHARQFFLHLDYDGTFEDSFLSRLNKVIGPDIAFDRWIAVEPHAHARFAAISRSYEYHLEFKKNPFSKDLAYFFPQANLLDVEKMQAAAQLLLSYEEFYPFCKSNSDAKTMKCDMKRAEWEIDALQNKMIFHISANRFLRGMVRLIVGMCLNVGMGKTKMEEVRSALEEQSRLTRSYSAPPHGLYLSKIEYPFLA